MLCINRLEISRFTQSRQTLALTEHFKARINFLQKIYTGAVQDHSTCGMTLGAVIGWAEWAHNSLT